MKHTPSVALSPRRPPVRMPGSALVRSMKRHAQVFAGDSWEGMWTAQPFICTRRHKTVIAPRNLTRQRLAGCRECAIEDTTARRVHAMSAQAGVTWLDAPWRGTMYHCLRRRRKRVDCPGT